MSGKESVALQEKKWQQQDDAHALARAEEIKKDPVRLKGAATAAKLMHSDAQKHAESMKKVATIATKSSQTKRIDTQNKKSSQSSTRKK